MERRKLGATGIDVSPIALGGNVFGWTVTDDAVGFKILDAFSEAGGNFINSADVYPSWAPGNQGGESERMIGKWMKASGKREQTVLATKVGMEGGVYTGGLSDAYIIKSVERSLQNLQTDYIDVYLSHTDDTHIPLEETLTAYSKLLEQGKVRAIGASNYTAPRLSKALSASKELGIQSYQVFETRYNLYNRSEYETVLAPICEGNGIGVISYSSLANGFLTGKYRSKDDFTLSPRGEGVIKKYLNDRGLRILGALDEVALEYKTTLATVAIAWLLTRRSITSAIASATSVEQVNSLSQATQLKLETKAIEKLTGASA